MPFLSSSLIKANLMIQSLQNFSFYVYPVIKKLYHCILVQMIISLTGKK